MNRGISILEVLVSASILSITLAGLATLTNYLGNLQKGVNEKFSSLEVRNEMTLLARDTSIYTFELTNAGPWISASPATFDASAIGTPSPPVIQLNQILGAPSAGAVPVLEVGKAGSPLSSSLIIQSIVIKNFSGLPTGSEFSADIVVTFDRSRTERSIKPVSTPIVIHTTGAGALKTVTSASSSSPAASGVRRAIALNALNRYHTGCGPASGYSAFESPPYGSPSPGMVVFACFMACHRYCGPGCRPPDRNCPSAQPGLGFSGGSFVEYSESQNVAGCACIP